MSVTQADGSSGTSEQPGWAARLSLGFDVRRGVSTMARSEHFGPLRVQRAFYPEGERVCHVYLLHPPGGVAGGDSLAIDVRLERGAHALLTTPGAAKLYRSQDKRAHVSQQLTLAAGATLEWLPQETIVFEGADATLETHVEAAEDSVYAGWEIVCLGRPACGEGFTRGALRTALSVRVGGKLRFMERGRYRAGDDLLVEAWGLRGAPVFGTFLVLHPSSDAEWLDDVREQVVATQGLFAVTALSGFLLARYIGASTRDARHCFARMFDLLRPRYAGRAAITPRIWRT